jgi:hypothetical protein
MKARDQNIDIYPTNRRKGELHVMNGMQTFMGITEKSLTDFEQENVGLLE